MELLILFIVMNVLNVVIQTIKSIATIKCGKWGAAVVNALAYGLYTYIVVLTMCDLPLLAKCAVVAGANFVGVWFVKWAEEKTRKDKLWRIDLTIPAEETDFIHRKLADIPHNYIECGPKTVFNCYCATQKESAEVKTLAVAIGGKYSAFESVKM